jgi:hypothetical protein
MIGYDDDKRRQAYKALIRFIHWKVHRAYEPSHWALSFEDLEAECLLALSRCMDKYLDTVPFDEFLYLARTAIHRAITDVKAMVYGTHRVQELSNRSLQEEVGWDDGDGLLLEDVVPGLNEWEPEWVYDSAECVSDLAAQLEPDELKVFAALLGHEPRMMGVLNAVRLRRDSVFKDPNVRLTPHILAVATATSDATVERSLKRLSELLGGTHGYDD